MIDVIVFTGVPHNPRIRIPESQVIPDVRTQVEMRKNQILIGHALDLCSRLCR